MRYRDAVKLHTGDEVRVKSTDHVVRVIAVDHEPRLVRLYCDDGVTYTHIDVK